MVLSVFAVLSVELPILCADLDTLLLGRATYGQDFGEARQNGRYLVGRQWLWENDKGKREIACRLNPRRKAGERRGGCGFSGLAGRQR
jgi:hypothetical protein